MPIEAIGALTVSSPGTLVRATQGFADPNQTQRIHGIMFQTLPGNTGFVYIGKANMDRTTKAGVIAVLAVPTENTLPTFSAALTWSANNLFLQEYYVDADSGGDGVLCTYLYS